MNSTILLLILLTLAALAAIGRAIRVPARHRWRRRQARAMAIQLQGRDRAQPVQLVYARVRAMDPLAFEELLLECFARRGLKIVRNRRYTGDGGVDGRVVIEGRTVLIQAKRYAAAIRPDHVADFIALCRARRCHGLFIHTGRTGPQSRQHVATDPRVSIVSGAELIALLRGDPVACLATCGSARTDRGLIDQPRETKA